MGARGPTPKQKKPGNLEQLPEAPGTLKAWGKQKWDEIGRQLIELRLVDGIDVHALEQLCIAYDQADKAQQEVDQYGYTVMGEKGPYLNPSFAVLSNAKNLIKHYIGALGLTRKTRLDIDSLPENKKRAVSSRLRPQQ